MYHKKTLGQHFLRNPKILGKIVDAAKLAPDDTVLEVGPGEGTLTALLLEKVKKVVAVEKDNRLIPVLQQKFSTDVASGRFEIVHGDVLAFDPSDYKLKAKSYKLVANLPYYITGQFLRKFLGAEHQPSSLTLLLQKEVAKRIVAADGRESVLSISVKCYGEPGYIATVKAGSFSPPPKVDSAILAIENISKKFFERTAPYSSFPKGGARRAEDLKIPPAEDGSAPFRKGRISEQDFFFLLKRGFAHPRKLLASNLAVSKDVLLSCGISAYGRAENVSLPQWKCVVKKIARESGSSQRNAQRKRK